MAYYNYKCRMCGKIYADFYSKWCQAVTNLVDISNHPMEGVRLNSNFIVRLYGTHICNTNDNDIGLSDLIGISRDSSDLKKHDTIE